MELSFPNASCFLLLAILICRLLVCGEGRDDDYFPSALEERLHDLRTANFPRLQRYSDDSRVPHGLCKTWLGTVVEEKSTWEEEHCRRCVCDPMMGRVCTQPQCDIDFHPYLHVSCEEWSPDGCCCLRASCVHEGARFEVGDWFPLTSADPCTLCKCDPSNGLPQCTETVCPAAPLEGCVDATTLPGECCPECVTGRNCGVPPLATKVYVIDDTSPIAEAASRIVTSVNDTNVSWNCTCRKVGSNADCFFLGSTPIT
ncbi:hypothetical protein ACOMHN_052112 [Nucella lapillus]